MCNFLVAVDVNKVSGTWQKLRTISNIAGGVLYFLSVLGIVSLAELMIMSVELGEVTGGSVESAGIVDLRKSSTAFLELGDRRE